MCVYVCESFPLAIFAKTLILNVCQGPEYASDKTDFYVRKIGLVLFHGQRLHTTDTVKCFGSKINEDLDFKYCCKPKISE